MVLSVARVLIVSPHFPPVNAADMQRVRMLLPYLSANGWEAEVLAVVPEVVAAPQDPWLAEGAAPEVLVHRVRALGLGWGRIPGLGTLGFRALAACLRKGDQLLGSKAFDLVYFSTTQWPVHLLGPRWKKRFKTPFVMDYQDPWVSDYYRSHPAVLPPGGRAKYALADRLSRWMEPRVLRHCAGITSVSESYPAQLRSRYEFLPPQWPVAVIPFPGDPADFQRALAGAPAPAPSPFRNWVYVGRGGQDMALSARALFAALCTYGQKVPGFLDNLKLHFVGTSYAAAGKGTKSIEPLAAEFGLEAIVSESTDRISYADTLRCLAGADALMVLGSDDPAYTASKIYPYLLAGKPLLAVFHRDSSVVELMGRVGGGRVVCFQSGESAQRVGARILEQWLQSGAFGQAVALDQERFAPYSAAGSAKSLTAFWNRCLSNR